MAKQFYFVFQLLLVVETIVSLVVEGKIWVFLVTIGCSNFVAVFERFFDVHLCWTHLVASSRAIQWLWRGNSSEKLDKSQAILYLTQNAVFVNMIEVDGDELCHNFEPWVKFFMIDIPARHLVELLHDCFCDLHRGGNWSLDDILSLGLRKHTQLLDVS